MLPHRWLIPIDEGYKELEKEYLSLETAGEGYGEQRKLCFGLNSSTMAESSGRCSNSHRGSSYKIWCVCEKSVYKKLLITFIED